MLKRGGMTAAANISEPGWLQLGDWMCRGGTQLERQQRWERPGRGSVKPRGPCSCPDLCWAVLGLCAFPVYIC